MNRAYRPRTPAGIKEARQAASVGINAHARDALMCDGLDWYMVQTAPQREWIGQAIVAEHGHPVFLPTRDVWRRRNRAERHKRRVQFALIPRCLFLAFTPGAEDWLRLYNADAITGVVSVQGKPRALPPAQLQDFLHRIGGVSAPDHQRYMRSRAEFAVGDTVRVVDGPLAGQLVEVTSIRGASAEALADLFGDKVPIKAMLDNLERL